MDLLPTPILSQMASADLNSVPTNHTYRSQNLYISGSRRSYYNENTESKYVLKNMMI